MKALSIEPNSPEWFEFRHQSIGASDIPIILGLSQYKKRSRYLHEKLDKKPPEQKSNPIATLGHQAEEELRGCVNKAYKLNLVPLVVQLNDVDDLHASLDGIDRSKKIQWECKLTGKNHYEQLKNNFVPPHFYCQIQFQFYITNYTQCLLSAIKFNSKDKKNFSENIHKVVKRNDDFIKQIILPSIAFFRADLLKLKTKKGIEKRCL